MRSQLPMIPHKELYILTGTETFAKESKLAKLLRELKPTLVSCKKKGSPVFLLWQICCVLGA